MKTIVRRARTYFVVALAVTLVAGCAKYTTPGAGVSIPNLSQTDADIKDVLKVEPAAPFPARLAVARVQASGYASQSNRCYGTGRYCVVTTRDIEPEASFEKIARLPQIAGLALVNRLLLPERLESTKDLRLAAAALKADMLLIYSFDTGFNVDSKDVGPLAVLFLGYLPNKKAKVTSTASAAIFDVRTGFLYGVAEATAMEQERATIWSSASAVDKARRRAEAAAFGKLVGEITRLWNGVVDTHAGPGRASRG
jgi:hypothetical protein